MSWTTHLAPGALAVLHAGRGDRWTWTAEGPRVDDGRRTWSWRPEGVQVRATQAAPPSERLLGAESGFLYRWATSGDGPTPVDVLAPGERWAEGPGGAVLIGSEAYARGAAPGRTPQPLPCPLLPEPLRWREDGRGVAGLTSDERGVTIDLATRTVTSRPPGVPVAFDVWLWPDGTVRRGKDVLMLGGREGSCAVQGELLAGPGGRLWSLRTGRPLPTPGPVIALGATIATPTGFATVHWQDHEGWFVDSSGACHQPFRLPLDDDDTVLVGAWHDGAAWWQTAEGRGFRVTDGEVSEVSLDLPHPTERLVPSPAGPLRATGTAHLSGHRFVFNDDGWLWALPDEDQSASVGNASS